MVAMVAMLTPVLEACLQHQTIGHHNMFISPSGLNYRIDIIGVIVVRHNSNVSMFLSLL